MNTRLQTIQHTPNVRCAHCKGYHTSVDDVRECSRIQGVGSLAVRPAAPEQKPFRDPVVDQDPNTPIHLLKTRGASEAQLRYIYDLGGNAFASRLFTWKEASNEITRLKGEKAKEKVVAFETKIPIPMLEALMDGYYAVQLDAADQMKFFRVSHPKKNWAAGSLKIQSIHGEILKDVLFVWPGGERGTWRNRSMEGDLIGLVVDPNGSAIRYAQEIGHCCRCNKQLTDDRSRWYGIGPECEKVWSHMIHIVNESRGPFGS